jgi:hypothetical protein
MGENTQPPFPGTRNNVDLKRLEAGDDRGALEAIKAAREFVVGA